MNFVHVYVGSDGESHFSDREFAAVALPPIDGLDLEIPGDLVFDAPASNVQVMRLAPGYRQPWSSEEGIIGLILNGTVTLRVSDGEERQIPQGTIVRVDDEGSRGHLLWTEAGAVLALVRVADSR